MLKVHTLTVCVKWRPIALRLGTWLGIGIGVTAAAAQPPRAIVVESHVGERPRDAARVLAPIAEELTKFGFSSGVQAVGEPYEDAVSRPGLTSWRTASEITITAEQGYEAFISGRFSEASALLVPLLADIRTNPAMIASQQAVRQAVFKASVAAAISQARLGQTQRAESEMAELLRSFPDQVVTRSSHGPEAERLYLETKRRLARNGRGLLHVTAATEDTSIYVNELFADTGEATRTDLMPGTYRVYAQRGAVAGRVYVVGIEAERERSLRLDWDYDQTLHTSPYWVGFTFATEAARGRLEAAAAARFAAELAAEQIIVLAITTSRGRPVLIGSYIEAKTNTVRRTASIALDPDPSVGKLVAMAQFLAGQDDVPGFEDASAGVAIEAPPSFEAASAPAAAQGSPAGERDRPKRRRSKRWVPYTALGAGALAAGAATALFVMDNDGTCGQQACVYRYETTGIALGAAATSAALLSIATVGFLKGWHKRPVANAAPAVVITPSAAVLSVRGHF